MIKKFKGLEKVKKIHMIGIGGVSMSGIAIILQKAGYEVPAVQGQLLPGLQGRAAPGSRKKRREIIGLFSARRLRYNKA